VMREPAVQQRTTELGAVVTATSRAAFGQVLQTEATRFSELVKEFGITAAG